MTKTEIIDAVAEKSGLSKKDSKLAVDAILVTLTETLSKKESVAFLGFILLNLSFIFDNFLFSPPQTYQINGKFLFSHSSIFEVLFSYFLIALLRSASHK